MSGSFSVTRLVNSRAIVRGTDKFGTSGETVLDTTQWDEINGHSEYDQATEAFERAVEDFFRPLTEAAEAASAALTKPTDSISYVVQQEEVPATQGQREVLVKLSRDSIVLRLLDVNDYDRLVWVDGSLEILEAEPAPASKQETVDALRDAGLTEVAGLVEGDDQV